MVQFPHKGSPNPLLAASDSQFFHINRGNCPPGPTDFTLVETSCGFRLSNATGDQVLLRNSGVHDNLADDAKVTHGPFAHRAGFLGGFSAFLGLFKR